MAARMSMDYLQEVEEWRRGRLERLTAPEGWLSLAGLWWLREGSNTVGSDSSNDVVLPAPAPAFAGTIEVSGGRAILHADPDAGLRSGGSPVTDIELRDGTDGTQTRIRVGPVSFTVIRREDELAVRVRDREQPARSGFAGIRHYPVDPAWRIEARFEPDAERREIVVPAVAGPGERYVVAGAAAFEAPNTERTHRLLAFEEEPEQDLFFVFGDATNPSETYPGGRYMYMPPPGEGGQMVLDFNRAYNPPCVFTPYATCPFALPENRLAFRVEAGELRYEGGSTGAGSEPNPSG
jgi:uncharacterized protein (DUF1684 family)